MLIREGFPGQRLRVLPAPLARSALNRKVTKHLLVTDAGYFPRASAHGRLRPNGAAQAIVILCVDGAGWWRGSEDDQRIEAGQAIVIPPNVPHAYGASEHEPWTIWFLHAVGEDAADFVSTICGTATTIGVVDVRDVFSAAAQMEAAVRALENDETEPSLIDAAGAAWRLLALLAADQQRGPAASADRIVLVQNYLRDNLSSRYTVAELARLAGLSTSYFSTLFKASSGIGVVEYTRRLRVARARELLLTTEQPVSSIAAYLGYEDAFYFTRQFRAINGISPSEFRKQAKREAI